MINNNLLDDRFDDWILLNFMTQSNGAWIDETAPIRERKEADKYIYNVLKHIEKIKKVKL